MEILLITILTTLVSDVYLQGRKTVELRNNTGDKKNFFIGHIKHAIQIGLLLFTVTFILFNKYIGLNNILIYVGIITFIHIIVDMIKCSIGKKIKGHYAFLADQLVHLATSIYICNNWGFKNTHIFPYIDEKVFCGALLFGIVYIYTVRCGEFFIDLFMKENFENVIIQNKNELSGEIAELKDEIAELRLAVTASGDDQVEEEDFEGSEDTNEVEDSEKKTLDPTGNDTGRYIGILERSIVLFLVVSNNYSSIALLLTGKSIARNKEFENKEFAVKFIVGTFLSILIGIIGGEMFKVTMKYFINL